MRLNFKGGQNQVPKTTNFWNLFFLVTRTSLWTNSLIFGNSLFLFFCFPQKVFSVLFRHATPVEQSQWFETPITRKIETKTINNLRHNGDQLIRTILVLMNWPALIPDLNPIEHLGGIIVKISGTQLLKIKTVCTKR